MGVEFQYFKQFITHIYKHIDERNGLVFMFISITFPNIATLYEMMEAFLPSLITENLTFVQYLFLCIFDMLLQTPCAKDYVTQPLRTICVYSTYEVLVIRDTCAIYVIHKCFIRFHSSMCADVVEGFGRWVFP